MISTGDFTPTVHFIDHYLTEVPFTTVDKGGLPDGVDEGALVWANVIDDPNDVDGHDSLLCVVSKDDAWTQIDPGAWDFEHDFMYVSSTNLFGRLVLFGLSEWRIVAVNS